MNRITLQIQLRGFVVEYFFLNFFLLFKTNLENAHLGNFASLYDCLFFGAGN